MKTKRIALLCVGLLAAAGAAEARLLCENPFGHVRVRERCQRQETPVDVRALLAASPDAVPLENWEVTHDATVATDVIDGLEAVAAVNASSLISLAPCRLVDTRPGFSSALAGVDIGPLGDQVRRTYTLEGNCGVPLGAKAISINLAIVPVLENGFASIGPTGSVPAFPPGPSFASINFSTSLAAVSNSLVVPLDALGRASLYVSRSANAVIDTNGYFAPPTDIAGNTAYGVDAFISNVSGGSNSAFGSEALELNSAGSTNTAIGARALATTTASGNTAVGAEALEALETGANNTCVGVRCLEAANTAFQNASLGANAMRMALSSSQNVAIGFEALHSALGSDRNVAIGDVALDALNSGGSNVGVGSAALGAVTSGSRNVAVGQNAGLTLTSGSDNVYVAHNGGTGVESNTIRIGTAQTATYIAGINGSGVDALTQVYVGSDGKLGTVMASSRSRKQDVENLAGRSRQVLDLRP